MAESKNDARLRAEKELFQRQSAYAEIFKDDSPLAKMVLTDLAQFCRAHESTFHADPRIHALQEGRREVFLRIVEYLNLDSRALWELKTKTKY